MTIFFNELKEWIMTFISFIPGNIGKIIRRLIYKLFLKSSNKINIDRGCIILSGKNIRLGKSVSIGRNSFITATDGKLIIGENSVIGMNAHINADCSEMIQIGSNCIVGPNLLIRASNHNYQDTSKLIREQGHIRDKVIIENNVWIGANVTILGKAHIKSGSVIAAGSVVFKEFEDGVLIAGNPAVVVKELK